MIDHLRSGDEAAGRGLEIQLPSPGGQLGRIPSWISRAMWCPTACRRLQNWSRSGRWLQRLARRQQAWRPRCPLRLMSCPPALIGLVVVCPAGQREPIASGLISHSLSDEQAATCRLGDLGEERGPDGLERPTVSLPLCA